MITLDYVTRRRSLKHDLHKYPRPLSFLQNSFLSFLDTRVYSAIIMFSYACYSLFIFGQAGLVISSLPDESMSGANLGFTTQDQQDPISVPDPGDSTAAFPGATNSFDISAVNPSKLQPVDSAPGQTNGGENTAFLFDGSSGGEGGTDILIPSAPYQIPEGVPGLIDNLGRWFSNPKKPECKNNKYPICCQKGAPQLSNGKVAVGRTPIVEPKVLFDPVEYPQRRRECRSCKPSPFSSTLFPRLLGSTFSLKY